MQQFGYTEVMKLNTEEDRVTAQPAPGAAPIVFEAIVKKLALAATYNRGEITLAPHILYTRHGEMYVDGVTLERDGKPPKEAKVGAFKLAGLSPLRLTARRFVPDTMFDANDAKYADVTLMAIDRD